jgi:hypothetical protein
VDIGTERAHEVQGERPVVEGHEDVVEQRDAVGLG